MFTWICPQCGREVPPAYNDCPNCHPQATVEKPAEAQPIAAPPVPNVAPPAAPPEPVRTYTPPPPPPAAAAPEPPVAEAAPAPRRVSTSSSFLGPLDGPAPAYTPPPPPVRHGLPTWLLTIVFVLAFFGLGSGVYWLIGSMRGPATTPSATVESPAAKPNAQTSPWQKYIEIAGVRFVEEKKKPMVSFVLVNHSTVEIGELGGNVTLWGRTRTSEEEATGTFAFKTTIGANESRELKVPLTTKLKFYELPDWQNVTADIQITVPAASGGSAALH